MQKRISIAVLGLAIAAATARADSTLIDNQYLFAGQSLVAPSCYYKVTFQSDGNLVLTTVNGQVLWASGTNGTGAGYAVLQPDGNFVLYRWDGVPVWASNTNDHPFDKLVMQDDGNLVLYAFGDVPVWATNTNVGTLGTTQCAPSRVVDARTATNMYGGDYTGFDISQPQPLWCAYDCAEDTRCNAYTYVPPGVQGSYAKCWLKSTQPSQSYAPGLISGLVYH